MKIDKEKLRDLAIRLDDELDKAHESGVSEALVFKSYLSVQKEQAKNMEISKPVTVNTSGAYRHWFSETALGGCPEVCGAFAKFTNCIEGLDQDPKN